jgi:Tfp pilus assembly protein PilF
MEPHPRIKILLEYIADDPSDASTKYMLALEYIKAGDDNEARKWMEEIRSNHPEYLPNYYHLGKLLERSGQFNAAAEIYLSGMQLAKVLKNNHTFNELKSALDMLDV